MKVGSIRLALMQIREARRLKESFILLIVAGWFAMTFRMLAKSPEQIRDSTSRAVFFYSWRMKEV